MGQSTEMSDAASQRKTFRPTRRQWITATVASSVVLLVWGRHDQNTHKQEHDSDEEDLALLNGEMVRLLQAHPTAEVHVLQSPQEDDASLIIAIQESGVTRAETIWHMRDNGWIEQRRQERRKHPAEFSDADASDISPGEASGFITEHNGHPYVISNKHVLEGASNPFEELMTMNGHRDIAVAPGEIIARCQRDPYDLPFVSVSKDMTSADLLKRTVRIRGMGSQLYQIEGKPFLIEQCINGDAKCTTCAGKLALVIDVHDMQQEDLIGMSGSRIEDVKTGDIVGIFDSAPSVIGLRDRFLMRFSGPEDIRFTLEQADRRRIKDQARYDLQRLMQPAPSLVPPSPDP